MNPLSSVQNPALEALAKASQPSVGNAQKGGDESFGKQLMDVLKEVNDAQKDAAETKTDMMTGRRNVDYHDLMISMEKANVAMQLTMSVRNKLLDAYQEISRTQV
jgi:flagellar hook-basal body complex protein FliE